LEGSWEGGLISECLGTSAAITGGFVLLNIAKLEMVGTSLGLLSRLMGKLILSDEGDLLSFETGLSNTYSGVFTGSGFDAGFVSGVNFIIVGASFFSGDNGFSNAKSKSSMIGSGLGS
jgi:hypothetical protein